jgi:radical SAM superfamily enzyme YgiQ (UPF0313 family)
MKILFVSHIPDQYVKDRDPLGIMCLAATLKQAKHKVRICSPYISEVEKILSEFAPKIIAYSIATGDHIFYADLNSVIKKKYGNIYSVFGGPHATFFPGFIAENPGVDATCVGEADLAFVDFVNRFESKNNYHLTQNFHVRMNGKIYRNPIRNHIDNLDILPFPDRGMVYNYYPKARNEKTKSFMTQRGCPYPCTYCFNHKFNEMYKGKGKIMRRRSVDHVIKEVLDVASKYPLDLVYFRDDSFNVGWDWVEEFSEKYEKHVKIPFVCTSNLNAMNEKVAKELKRAGCVTVEVGIEAGNSRVRNEIYKRHMKNETIVKGMKLLKSNGIKIMSENILGSPGSTLEEDLDTFSLNRKCKVDYINSGMMQPYFGTAIHEYAKKLKVLGKESTKDIKSNTYLSGQSILNIENKKQRERLNKIIAVSAFLRMPRSMVKFLIYLPLQPLYSLINILFKGYSGTILYPSKRSLKATISAIIDVLKMNSFLAKMKLNKR